MRPVKAEAFDKDYKFQAAKKAARKAETARRSGRRGSVSRTIWSEGE